jgi:hypothetical protein
VPWIALAAGKVPILKSDIPERQQINIALAPSMGEN